MGKIDMELSGFRANGTRFPEMEVKSLFVTSGDVQLCVYVFGKGYPVLFSHGGMGHSGNWAFQVSEVVNAGYQVILTDTRGHGKSTRGNSLYSYDLLASDIEIVMNYLAIQSAILVGWSDGACSSLTLALKRPHRVKGLIFFGCNVNEQGLRDDLIISTTIENCIERHKTDYRELSPFPDQFEALFKDLEAMQKFQPNYHKPDLASVSVPVTVLHAEHDEFIREDHELFIAQCISNAEFEIIPGVSHFAPIQNPQLFNSILLKHLNNFFCTRFEI